MTGSTTGAAYPLHYEAAAAGNGNPTSFAPLHHDHTTNGRMAASLTPRERRRAELVDRIKRAVANMVLTADRTARVKDSYYLSSRLGHDYTYLANLFSETTGSTIKQYIIEFRICRVKEFLTSTGLSLTQISHRLNYSSVAHLSNQFKKVTGLTPSSFKILQLRHGIMPESGNDVTVFCNPVNIPEVRRVSFVM